MEDQTQEILEKLVKRVLHLELAIDKLYQKFEDLLTFMKGVPEKFDPDVIDIAGASLLTGLAISTIRRRTMNKTIPFVKKGKRVYYSIKKINEWMPTIENRVDKKFVVRSKNID